MAHIQKFNRAQLGHMLAHYARRTSPEHVQTGKTRLNYNLAERVQPLGQMDFIKQRLEQVKVQNRKNVNLMCDCVVTAPKSLDQRDYKKFFKAVFKSLSERYGKENVISAYVHMDEVTPHMHFAFIPITHDLKRGIEKVCAKDVVNRVDLQTLHTDLEADVSRYMGYHVEMLNGATKGGNKSIQELRAKSKEGLIDELLATDVASINLIEENERLKRRIEELERKDRGRSFFDSMDDFER